MRFRLSRPAATLAAGLALVLLLAGCVPPDPIITPEPGPGATPVFASDEEALAAATDAYAKYVKVTDEVFQDPGSDLFQLSEVSTGDLLKSNIDRFQEARAKKWRSVGQTKFDQVTLQKYDVGSFGEAIVVTYLCEDISAVDVLDASGHSVVSANRPDRVLYEVTFDLSADKTHLKVSNRVPWSRDSC